MPRSNILVVVIDGLRASALGSYGNTTYPTSALDRFAAHSLVFDACYAPAAELADVYSALWRSHFPKWATTATPGVVDRGRSASMPRSLCESGYHTTLITDEPQLLEFEGGQDFDDCVQICSRHDEITLASELAETSLARLFAAADDTIERLTVKSRVTTTPAYDRPQVVWLHARGLYGPWDAPLDLQEPQLDADDSPPILSATPPDFQLGNDDDPDIIFQHGVAYAAQVMVLDACWQSLTQLLPPHGATGEWLVLVLGGRGYCLGEHQQIGGIDPRLPAEQLHVPWLIRFPEGRGQLARSSALVSHADVMPTLLDWVGSTEFAKHDLVGASILPLATPQHVKWRTTLLTVGKNGAYSVRNSSWTLCGLHAPHTSQYESSELSMSDDDTSPKLFVRPDDRWEANDVAKLCPEVVDDLEAAATTALRQLQNGEKPALMKSPD